MKSVTEIISWLNTSEHVKCILADISEVGPAPGSNFFLSSTVYDSNGVSYDASITGGLSFSESLNLEGTPSLGIGSLEIVNVGGINDNYLTYVWNKRPIKIYLGDPSWPKSDFVLIFDGLIQELTAPNENTLSFTLFDKLQRLNDPVSEKTLKSSAPTTTIVVTGATITSNIARLTYATQASAPFTVGQSITVTGIPNFNGTFTVTLCNTTLVQYALSATNQTATINPSLAKVSNAPIYSQSTQDTVLPLLFGECFNVTPLLVDNGSSNLGGQVYMVHDGTIDEIIEVRDNGVPIPVEIDLNTGTFELLTSPYGTITCSAKGSTPYSNTVAGIITKIVTGYGTEENRFQTTEVDFSSFNNESAVGLYCNERINILEVCSNLAKSVQANLVCPAIVVNNDQVSVSKLRLVEIKVPTDTPKYYLNDDNMVLNSLSISEVFPVKPSVKLAYCKNHSVQVTTAAGVNPASKFEDEYIFVSAVNSTKRTLYRDSGTVTEEQTLLLSTTQAQTEANKRLALWQDQRFIITASYLPYLIFAQLGDTVQVQSDRFGLSNGKLGMIYSITRNWVTGQVEIGVLI